jgi:hypothetical protein
MNIKLKKFLRAMSPLMVVQLFLFVINIATTGLDPFWSVYPIAGMMIPELIVASQIFLADDDNGSASQQQFSDSNASRKEAREAAREFKREAKKVAHDIKRGNWDGELPTLATSAAGVPNATNADASAQFDVSVQDQLAQAKRYKQQVESLLKANPSKSALMADVSSQINDWMKTVETMATRITDFKRNPVIQNDLKTVPDAIQKLEGQVASEVDVRVKARLEQTLQTRRNQLTTLEKLQSSMRQAEVQLESTVASLGTIYSQVLTAQSTNQVADYGHLATEVTEQVHQLQDQIEALEEVKLGQTGQTGQTKRNLG